MKKSILTVLAAILAAAPAGYAQENGRFVAVDGEASVSVSPDMATLRLGTEARNADLEAARAEVLSATRRFLDFAEDAGIDEDDIRSSGLNIRPEYRWNREENQQEMLGYYVQREITVSLEDIGKLGRILEGAVETGINNVQPPVLGHSKEKALKKQALAEATRDARANADEIARALGARVGDVRKITSTQAVQPMPRYAAMAMRESDAPGAETYLTGQITIEARVSAEFDLIIDDEAR